MKLTPDLLHRIPNIANEVLLQAMQNIREWKVDYENEVSYLEINHHELNSMSTEFKIKFIEYMKYNYDINFYMNSDDNISFFNYKIKNFW